AIEVARASRGGGVPRLPTGRWLRPRARRGGREGKVRVREDHGLGRFARRGGAEAQDVPARAQIADAVLVDQPATVLQGEDLERQLREVAVRRQEQTGPVAERGGERGEESGPQRRAVVGPRRARRVGRPLAPGGISPTP